MNQCMTLSVDAEGVALVTIDVQGRPMNVLTPDFHAQLNATLGGWISNPKFFYKKFVSRRKFS